MIKSVYRYVHWIITARGLLSLIAVGANF